MPSSTPAWSRILRAAWRAKRSSRTIASCPAEAFCDTTLQLTAFITRQSAQISRGVSLETSRSGDQGAGDQGIMFGYATDEIDEMMPLPILRQGLVQASAELEIPAVAVLGNHDHESGRAAELIDVSGRRASTPRWNLVRDRRGASPPVKGFA